MQQHAREPKGRNPVMVWFTVKYVEGACSGHDEFLLRHRDANRRGGHRDMHPQSWLARRRGAGEQGWSALYPGLVPPLLEINLLSTSDPPPQLILPWHYWG